MPDILILVGLLAIVVERGIEPVMNFVKGHCVKPPEKGQDLTQTIYRLIAFTLAVGAGLLITFFCRIDLINEMFPDSEIGNGWILTGFIIGLGSAPAHEAVNYIEQKKNKAKEERRIAQETDQPPNSSLSTELTQVPNLNNDRSHAVEGNLNLAG
jgi:hypothetical protein